MLQSVPPNFRKVFDQDQISEAVLRIGEDITRWAQDVWKESHSDVLAIPVLRGGLFFFADLVRRIDHSVEIASAQTWAYEANQNAKMRESIQVALDGVPAKGRAVLLVDDICDSGRTLEVLEDEIRQRGAREVRSAVLVQRRVPNKVFEPYWIGLEYEGSEWMVGCGMDDTERFRNLSEIYIIQQSASS